MKTKTRSAAAKKAWETRRANKKAAEEALAKLNADFPLEEFIHHPFDTEDNWEFRRLGRDLVLARGEFENHTHFSLFQPCMFVHDGTTNSMMDTWSLLQLADQTYWTKLDARFWDGVRGRRILNYPEDLRKEWEKLERLRIQQIVGHVYPEALDEHAVPTSYGNVMVYKLGTWLDASDLDTITDFHGDRGLTRYMGCAVEHDIHGRTGTLMQTRDAKPIVKWDTPCMKCGLDDDGNEIEGANRITFYTQSGCHHGAWCYLVHPETGEYEGDLRNVYVQCEDCA